MSLDAAAAQRRPNTRGHEHLQNWQDAASAGATLCLVLYMIARLHIAYYSSLRWRCIPTAFVSLPHASLPHSQSAGKVPLP